MSTVGKALELLELFTPARGQIGLSDLARLAGLNKATCFRLVSDLCAHGLVEQIAASRDYRLGPALLRLAALREALVPTRTAALPVLQALADATGETAHLSILEGGSLRSLARAYSAAHATRVTLEDVSILPFHATASGLAVLAFQDEAARAAVLAAPLPRLTPQTETDPATLRQRLEAVRRAGIASGTGGFDAEVESLAVPLFDALGRCSGGLAVAAMASRMTPAQQALIRAELIRAGRAITTLWGGTPPAAVSLAWQAADRPHLEGIPR